MLFNFYLFFCFTLLANSSPITRQEVDVKKDISQSIAEKLLPNVSNILNNGVLSSLIDTKGTTKDTLSNTNQINDELKLTPNINEQLLNHEPNPDEDDRVVIKLVPKIL
ncbi:hypothetical protein K502DRAFT_322427 [Neoconidiobolus thromboides FSU 785]|nr:hypothetical protein K502DRAFT_322427 [Neoconidiobolus thromboides FSU 785]